MYNGDLKWADLAKLAEAGGQTLINALIHGKDQYDEWLSFSAGRTNLQIAAALGAPVTEAQVAELGACFAAFKELYDAANNVATTTSDRFYSMRKFA